MPPDDASRRWQLAVPPTVPLWVSRRVVRLSFLSGEFAAVCSTTFQDGSLIMAIAVRRVSKKDLEIADLKQQVESLKSERDFLAQMLAEKCDLLQIAIDGLMAWNRAHGCLKDSSEEVVAHG